MDKLIEMVVGAKLAEGATKIYLPGEIEESTAGRRKREGIAVSASVLANLHKVANDLGVTPLAVQ